LGKERPNAGQKGKEDGFAWRASLPKKLRGRSNVRRIERETGKELNCYIQERRSLNQR